MRCEDFGVLKGPRRELESSRFVAEKNQASEKMAGSLKSIMST